MNKKKSLIITLVMVLVVGLSIAAGTFAYFQWTSGAEGGTKVNVTIEIGGITMHIEPETTEFVGLYPTAHCENNVRYGDALVTIVNNTGTLAIPSFRLKVRVTDKDGNGVPADALSHINYAVVPIETTVGADNKPVKGESTGGFSCKTTPYNEEGRDSGTYGYNILFSQAYEWDTHFKFENVDETGEWSHIPNAGDVTGAGYEMIGSYLPRQYYLSGSFFENGSYVDTKYKQGDVDGITFRGEAYTTSYQYFRVYVWIDEGYTSTIVGNTVSDPLQNAKIEITWSEESMVQQVSGESNNTEVELEPGLYDTDGNVVKTWQQLLDNNDITVEDNVITDSNRSLTGTLVIPEGITEIGVSAFESSSLTSITFAPGSQLTTIAGEAFYNTNITSIEIPSTVTSIGAGALSGGMLSSITFAPGSKLTTIGDSVFYGTNITSIEIPSTVTSIGGMAFADSFLSSITFAPGSQLTTIGESAFYYTNITSIEIPSTVTSIGSYAFSASSLSSITFAPGSQLTTIGESAFNGTDITSIEIPSTVTSIGASAFQGNMLSSITFMGTVQQWNAITKEDYWNSGVPATKVICSDGEVQL